MTISKQLLFSIFFFFLSLQGLFAFTINIKAPNYIGKTARLISEEDPISGKIKINAAARIDENGAVTLEGQIQEIGLFTINIDNVNAYLFISPNSTYSITFPALPEDQPRSINNTNEVDLIFNEIETGDINTLVTAFNIDYYKFYNNNSTLVGTRQFRSKVKAFEDSVSLKYAEINNAFFADYVRYSIAETKLLSGYSKRNLYDSLLVNRRIKLNNPAWFQFYNLFYASYFQTFQVEYLSVDLPRAISNGSLHQLDSIFQRDDFMKNDLLRRLVIVKSIKESYTDPRFNRNQLINLLQEIIALNEPILLEVAKNVEDKLLKNQLKTKPDDYTLINANGEQVDINDILAGKKTYLEITAPWCSSCKKETLYFQKLREEYGDLIQFITVFIETEDEDFQDVIQQSKIQEVYLAKNSYTLKTGLNIRSIPAYFILDESGKFTQLFAKKPSEGVEAVFYKLQTEEKEENKIRVGEK